MRILSIDIGTKMGYFFHNSENKHEVSGVFNNPPLKGDSDGIRFLKLKLFLNDIVQKNGKPDYVFFEEVFQHQTSQRAMTLYHGFRSTLLVWCEMNGVEYKGFPVATIKKFATGKGNASKEVLMHQLYQLGYDFKDDNECDAIWIGLLGMSFLNL